MINLKKMVKFGKTVWEISISFFMVFGVGLGVV
jgi:hypothetical protein